MPTFNARVRTSYVEDWFIEAASEDEALEIVHAGAPHACERTMINVQIMDVEVIED